MLVLFIYEFRLLKNLQYQILLEQHEKVTSKLQKMQTRFLQAQVRNQNIFMNFMIWSVALMYIYWMVIRDLMIPVAYSELIDKDFRDRLVKTTMAQSSILGVFTYVTALFFLAMYYYFANT